MSGDAACWLGEVCTCGRIHDHDEPPCPDASGSSHGDPLERSPRDDDVSEGSDDSGIEPANRREL